MLSKKEAWPILNKQEKIIIAGPCSAESEEQVVAIAKDLKEDKRVNIFRAGVWKPRTRPGYFEGKGSLALPWLKRVQKEYDLPVTIEVANVKHVYEALKFGVDILWLGARTSANPFAVQEIAEALKGVDIPVLVKNPVNPDVALWMGALERLERTGINRLGAVHRGVTQFRKSIFRNNPEWKMVVELRNKLPDLLLINDPSHIAGKRDLVGNVAQTAMDLTFDGLMIETHNDPDNAMSDAAQQITPKMLTELLNRLVIRSESPIGIDTQDITELRGSISHIDSQIIDLLGHRYNVVKDIARFKKSHKMTIFQESRWNDLIEKHTEQGKILGLNDRFISAIFHAIHQDSIENQNQVFNNRSD